MGKLLTKVLPLDTYILELVFSNGLVKYFDMKPYLKYPVFKPLQDINLFMKVQLDELGGVEWNLENGVSLSQDTLLTHMY